MTLHQPPAALVEDLGPLFPQLCRFAIACSRRLGCLHPDTCGTDVVTQYLTPRKPRETGHVLNGDGRITLNHPKARDQRKYLFGRVRLEARTKYNHCRECEHYRRTCRLGEAAGAAEDGGGRARREPVSPAMDPEELYRQKEFLEQIRRSVTE
ncbi:MAG: hypothetical protein M3348_18235, partial [Acidobacteriota bacterium]|nr:hypothetical protein [Acidobacteriota bacterium]